MQTHAVDFSQSSATSFDQNFIIFMFILKRRGYHLGGSTQDQKTKCDTETEETIDTRKNTVFN